MSRKAAIPADTVRRSIRDAMERLLLGKPIRSDGKLTVKSLAAEADVKRWVLTHQHPDLQDEFRARVTNQGETPEIVRATADENKALKELVKELKGKLSDSNEENHRLARVIQVLSLENQQMREALEGTGVKVHHLHPTK